MEGKHGKARGRLSRAGRRLLIAGLVVPAAIGAMTPGAHADGNTTITVSLQRTTPAVSVGNTVRYSATVKNTGPANSNNQLVFKGIVDTTSYNNGARVKSVTKTSGPGAWICGTQPGASISCSLAAGMGASETDTFEILVQARTSPGNMTTTAQISQGVPAPPHPQQTVSASDTVTVAAGPSSSGGTFSGYCPPGGCSISSGTYPGIYGTTRVPTQAVWTFPSGGFNFSFDLQTGNTCLPVVACDGWTTGAAVVPAGFGTANPIILKMLYDPAQLTVPVGSSPTSFKSTSFDPSSSGSALPVCSGTQTNCQLDTGVDVGGARFVRIRLASGDPRVGNFYFPP